MSHYGNVKIYLLYIHMPKMGFFMENFFIQGEGMPPPWIYTHFYSSINNKNAILRKHFHVKERVMRAATQHLSLYRRRQLSLTHYCGVPRKDHVFQKKQERKCILLSQQVLYSHEMMRTYRAVCQWLRLRPTLNF